MSQEVSNRGMSQSSLIDSSLVAVGGSSRSSGVSSLNNNANNIPKRNCLSRVVWYIIGCFVEFFQKIGSCFNWKSKNVVQQDAQEAAAQGNEGAIAAPNEDAGSSVNEAVVEQPRATAREKFIRQTAVAKTTRKVRRIGQRREMANLNKTYPSHALSRQGKGSGKQMSHRGNGR